MSAGETVLTEKVCQTLVQVLTTFSSTSAEICESVLELLQNHAEDGMFCAVSIIFVLHYRSCGCGGC